MELGNQSNSCGKRKMKNLEDRVGKKRELPSISLIIAHIV